MSKSAILLLIFILIISISKAQITISGKVGYGFYSMSELKTYQRVQLNEMTGIPAKIVESFPPYLNYKAFISFPRDSRKNWVRYYLGFETTGSRISLTDYSGKLTSDMVLNAYKVGVELQPFSKRLFNTFDLKGYVCVGETTTFLKLIDLLQVGEETITQNYVFCSLGMDIEPGLRAIYKFKRVGVGLSMGYLLDVNGTFFMKGSPKNKLGFSSSDLIQPLWAGFRTGIELSIDLNKKGH
jgi:hypothetical protein